MIDKQNQTALSQGDPRWKAVLMRDRSADNDFVYGVSSTGVYCRPSCPAKIARAENISFFSDCRTAEAAGFRACLRCMPNGLSINERLTDAVTNACRLIEEAETLPKLNTLAASVGMSASYFHRQFKSITGLTPKEYGAAHRAMKVRKGLISPDSRITDVILEAGFNASSRFYEKSNAVLGMTPTHYKSGGDNIDIRFAIGECSLGAILVASTEKGICAIFLGDDPEKLIHDLQDRFPKANLIGGDHDFEALVAKVVGFIEAPQIGLDLPLDIRGTAFQQRVWKALCAIPAGATISYSELAQRIGKPTAVRAVASAVGANKIAVAIPCHRVVHHDGTLSGYRWGVERKRILLEGEAQLQKGVQKCTRTRII